VDVLGRALDRQIAVDVERAVLGRRRSSIEGDLGVALDVEEVR
jgi:hypothetical protein